MQLKKIDTKQFHKRQTSDLEETEKQLVFPQFTRNNGV